MVVQDESRATLWRRVRSWRWLRATRASDGRPSHTRIGRRDLLTCLLGLSAATNGVQAWRIYAAEKRLADEAANHDLATGSVVPAFRSLDPARGVVTVVAEVPARPIVLYWMNDACVWCKRNEANFRFLAEALAKTHDVVAISSTSEGLDDLIERAPLPYRLVAPPDAEVVRAYRFGSTPMTIVVGQDRRVARIWYGAYFGKQRADVERFFHVVLPSGGL